MADTYYARLTLVNPRDLGKMDPSYGQIIAETATTGKFFLSDITLDQAVSPNKTSLTAFNIQGELKIFEPLGFRMLDYIRWASLMVGCDNHLDARYLLEVELVGPEIEDDDNSFRYIWPIMFLETNVAGSVNEKGTEYNIKWCHSGHHSQTSMVQPIKETKSIDASSPKEYFAKLSKALELQEFEYAKALQKASGPNGTKGGSGDHPAAADPYHDEYHFILDPEIENLGFTTKGKADAGVSRAWTIKGLFGNEWSITAKSGTTIIDQINKVLSQIKDIASLYVGRRSGATGDANGSSPANRKALEAALGDIYRFFRVETHTVYKEFDYIRGRYAVKHVFIIYLADQPNLYQYPDELDMLNEPAYQDKVITKLKAYIQEGLLRKAYYHMYTGLNTDVIRVDFQLNQAYFLPSFPVIWADRGKTGQGQMNLENYTKRVIPYVHIAKTMATRNKISELQNQIQALMAKLNDPKISSSEKNRLNKAIEKNKALLEERKKELTTSWKEIENEQARGRYAATDPRRIDKGRQQLLASYSGLYVEDDNYDNIMDALYAHTAALRPRMEPDEPISAIGEMRDENEKLMEKIFAVQLAARDLQELELEVFADPYWLGSPNMIMAGKKYFDRIKLPDGLKTRINQLMPIIDPEWNSREPKWGDYNQASYYSGSNMFYFNAQLPVNDFENDLMKFGIADQVIGIYVVKLCRNEFKDGKWIQKLSCVRDNTIPSKYLPRATGGTINFDEFVQQTIADPERALDRIVEDKAEEEAARQKQAQTQQQAGTPGVTPTVQTSSSDPSVQKALNLARTKLGENPPPAVANPVDRAQALVDSGVSKDQAYAIAKKEFLEQLKAYNNHVAEVNKKAYEEAGVSKYQPYNPDTLTGLVVTRSGSGGLDDWRKDAQKLGPWSNNNPGGLGFNSKDGTYNGYRTYQDGITAVNEYYNYGVGAPLGRKGADSLLLPSGFKESVFGTKTELDYILVKSLGAGR